MSDTPRESFERRFLPRPGSRGALAATLGGLGAATLGAGTAAAWLVATPSPDAPWILVGGAVLLAASAALPTKGSPLRVGAHGVAIERDGAQPERVLWCDAESVALGRRSLVVASRSGARIEVGLDLHAAAAARILDEALSRIASRTTFEAGARDLLPALDESASERVAADPPQLAGRACKASGVAVTFEADARLCPHCAELYHREHLPETCLGCGGATAG